MASEVYRFTVDDRTGFAHGHAGRRPLVTLMLGLGALGKSHDQYFKLTPGEARAMAASLEAAATFAENVIADTGLGESAVEAPTVSA